PAGAQEQRADADLPQSEDLGDLSVRRSLRVREPQKLALYRLELLHAAGEIGPYRRLALRSRRRAPRYGRRFFLQRDIRVTLGAPCRVAQEVRRDPEQ